MRSRTESRKRRRRYIIGAVVGVLALGMIVGLTVTRNTGGAPVGAHWHADLSIEICGQTLVLPPSPGGIHSHGDGLVHVHPSNASEAGDNAVLSRFFSSVGMVLDSDRIQFPTHRLYENGDSCPGGAPGEVTVEVNGENRTDDFRTHVIRNGDRVTVNFR